MDNMIFRQVLEAKVDLINIVSNFLLIKFFLHLKQGIQVPVSAVLTKNVAMIRSIDSIIIFENVGMFDFFYYLQFLAK